ncbi:MAG: hypothetical protein RLZ04_499 [Actinomycetota bacterium]
MPRLDAERIALWRQFCVAGDVLRRRIDQEISDEHGISLVWYDCLTALRDGGGTMRVSELCRALHEVPSSFSRRLDRMEDDGLLERRDPPRDADRRAVTVTMTSEGRAVWRDANVTYRRLVQQHFAVALTDTDIAALQRFLGKVI